MYDANGDTVELVDEEGNRTRQSFNLRGELMEVRQPFEHSGGKTTRFVTSRLEYDPVGNVVREISPRAYDVAPDWRTEGFPWYVTSHEYDAADRLSARAYPATTRCGRPGCTAATTRTETCSRPRCRSRPRTRPRF